MNWSPAAAVLVALIVCGCGSGGSGTSAGRQLIRTHGTLVRVGGPAPGAPVALQGVTVRFGGAGESVGVRTDRQGRFALDVAPGTYRVTIVAGGPQADGRPIQPTPRLIHVGGSGRLRLAVNIK